ncbi:MAG: class II glutamine amidotransferase [Polyangiaceae bacterium]|jgi:glutamine amidotransferase|nr:class II glutamine amidotransferase [Polyangiaceae bacterium]
MARLFAFIGNRSDLGPRILDVEAEALRTRARAERLGWGLGFYQAGEVLLRKRPWDEREEISVSALARDVRTDVLVGNVRSINFGEARTQNTQPYRFRNWLFAHAGTTAEFLRLRERLIASIPDFLRRNVRGDTDSELLFHLFLSFLHDAGHLRGATPRPATTEALRGSRAVIDRLSREEGAEDAGPMGLIVSNGEYVAGLNRGAHMAFRVIHGSEDIEALLPDDGLRRRRLPDMARVRFTILASEVPEPRPGWTLLPDRSTVVLGRLDEPVVETF